MSETKTKIKRKRTDSILPTIERIYGPNYAMHTEEELRILLEKQGYDSLVKILSLDKKESNK